MFIKVFNFLKTILLSILIFYQEEKETIPSDIADYLGKVMMDEDDEAEEPSNTVSFEVAQEHIEDLQKRL